MKIVHLGKYYPPAMGGIETYTQTLCQEQVREGMHVRAVVVNHLSVQGQDVTFSTWARTMDQCDREGAVRVIRLGRVANLARLDVTPSLPRILRQLERDRPDIWHLQTPNPAWLMALALRPNLGPIVITHHSDIIRQRLLQVPLRPLERLVYARAARIICSNPDYAEGSRALRPFREKIAVISYGIDLEPFVHPSPEAKTACDATQRTYPGPLWVCGGRLAYYKGLDTAIRAMPRVPGTLLVVGTGPMAEPWQQLARELRVADRVHWLGRVSREQLIGLYHAATALWFPSNARSEAFGITQVEAMASGCPVINTAVPNSGVAWVSQHDRSGLTVPVNDAEALAAAARRLVEDPELRNRLAHTAQQEAQVRFDQRGMAEATRALYQQVLAA